MRFGQAIDEFNVLGEVVYLIAMFQSSKGVITGSLISSKHGGGDF